MLKNTRCLRMVGSVEDPSNTYQDIVKIVE